MLYEHTHMTNLKMSAPQSHLMGTEKKKTALLFWMESKSKAVIYSLNS